MAKPLFEGFAKVTLTETGLEVHPPDGVVIPPGYEWSVEVHKNGLSYVATYEVREMDGIRAWWLRWWRPFRKET